MTALSAEERASRQGVREAGDVPALDGTSAEYSTRITSQVLQVILLFTEPGMVFAFVATA